jgi:hypothetical protein
MSLSAADQTRADLDTVRRMAELAFPGLPPACLIYFWLYPHLSCPPEKSASKEPMRCTPGSLWCGDVRGWIGLDPTKAMIIGNDHIVLAKGRGDADISPGPGPILGSCEHDVDVKVDVVPRT